MCVCATPLANNASLYPQLNLSFEVGEEVTRDYLPTAYFPELRVLSINLCLGFLVGELSRFLLLHASQLTSLTLSGANALHTVEWSSAFHLPKLQHLAVPEVFKASTSTSSRQRSQLKLAKFLASWYEFRRSVLNIHNCRSLSVSVASLLHLLALLTLHIVPRRCRLSRCAPPPICGSSCSRKNLLSFHW